MGVAETSPSVPRRDGEETYKLVGEPAPIASKGPGSGARRTTTPPGDAPNAYGCQICARGAAEAGWNIADVG
jgi:hypothetical protein